MHIVIDIFRMWLLVKVYKLGYGNMSERKGFVFFLLLLHGKYKFCSVLFNFNDTVMHLIALISIYFHLKSKFFLSIFFMGFAASVKMSALLYVPGCLLVSAFEYGILSALVYLIGIFVVQIGFGLEFLLKNPQGYFRMAYDFDRKFA
jgi:alpha-1,3-mannosyltransferase